MTEDRDRQLERAREALAAKDEEARARAEEEQISGADRAPDDQDVRVKSTDHGKKTADKWNQ